MSTSAALLWQQISVELGGHQILDSVSLQVNHGEILALVGPNGAGKSTLLAVACGDVEPTAGQVQLNGRDLGEFTARTAARERAVLLQEQQIAFGFLAREVVEMGRNVWHRTPAEGRDQLAVTAAMQQADVEEFALRRFPSLSGGEKSRVSLARVLAQETGIVLLDEPTAALDIGHQEQVLAVARELASAGLAVVVVLHDLSLAAAWADRVAVLKQGRVAAVGTPREVFTADLVSSVYEHPIDVIEHQDRLVLVPRRSHPVSTQSLLKEASCLS